ncbi:MAG: 4Fe-4S binding protein [Coriobacteriia bacterium]|nr:4Fe-4S binding protein [Coriobacteriia bacterium]MBN2823328.1 4Fe-4S binding protein [Coriobacteriia bacterium]
MKRGSRASLDKLFSHVGPRLLVRGGFFLFFVYISSRLLAFRAWALGQGPFVERPEAVAGLLPIGSYMSFFLWLKNGWFDPVLPAGIVIIIGALTTSLIFKRGFCGWICPVGSVWEAAAWLGRKVLHRDNYRPPRWLDIALRSVRYVLAAALMVWLAAVSIQEATSFQQLPYYATVDVKMILLFFTPVYMLVIAAAFIGMMLFGNVWCRYLCPLGGVYGACSTLSPTTIVRDADLCIDCGKCARSCHAAIAVDTLRSVRHAECDGCQDCVRACPVPGALEPRLLGRFRFPWWVWPIAVVVLWMLIYTVAVVTGNWHSQLPVETFRAYMQIPGL